MARIQGRRTPRLEARDRVWIARMRELAARAEHAEARALARRRNADVEDAEFEDRPVRALGRQERELAEPAVREIIRERGSAWMPLAIGLGIIAVIGVAGVVVYLLVRRKDNGESSVLGAVDPRYLPQQQAPQVYLINSGGGQATVTRAEAPQSDGAMLSMLGRIENGIGSLVNHNRVPYNQSTMRTYRLPWLADADNPAIRIATAGNASMEAVVRVVAPPGALAAFSFSANELNLPQRTVGPGMSTVPAGDTLVVPSGQQQEIHMNPKQVLYAKGNFSNANPTGSVVISISTVDNYGSR